MFQPYRTARDSKASIDIDNIYNILSPLIRPCCQDGVLSLEITGYQQSGKVLKDYVFSLWLGTAAPSSHAIQSRINLLGFYASYESYGMVYALRSHSFNITQASYEREILPHIVNRVCSFQDVVNNNRNLTARLSYPTQHPQHGTSGFSSAHNHPDSQYEQNIQQATRQSRITAYQHGDMPGTSNFLHSAQAGSSGLQQAGQSGGPVGGRPSSTSQRFAPYHQPTPQSSHSTLRSLLENPSPPSTSTRQRSLSLRSPVYTPGPVYTPVPENLLRPRGPKPATRLPSPHLPEFNPDEMDQYIRESIGRPPSRNR